MKRFERITRTIVAFIAIFSITVYYSHMEDVVKHTVEAKEKGENYIVCTESVNQIAKLQKEYDGESEILKENKMASLEMTASEAKEVLQDDATVFVEKDMTVKASSVFGMGAGKEQNIYKDGHKKKEKKLKKNKSEHEWNIRMIRANKATKKKKGSKVKVAVIDSGVDYLNDIDLQETITLVPGEEEMSPLFMDGTGHGNSVAGLIAATDNKEGITGINPNVDLYSIRVLDDENQAPISRVIEAIYLCIDRGVNIINMSFGLNEYSAALEKAVKDAKEAGILIIAAAGNTGEKGVQYPAAYEEVMAVGAVDKEGNIAKDSATGEEVELVAPGELVRSTGVLGDELVSSGTSLSAPQVAAAASLIWQKDLSVSADFVRSLLNFSANKYGDETKYGNGLLDVEYALEKYDEFRKEYKKADTVEMEENEREILSFEDTGCVEGSWTKNQHVDLMPSANSIIKKGTRFNDDKTYYANDKNKEGTYYFAAMTLNPWWHGYYKMKKRGKGASNYVAAYIFQTKLANAKVNGGWQSVSEEGLTTLQRDMMREQLDRINWSEETGKKKPSDADKRAFIWGMAIHSLTDTFSHSIYYNGEYVAHDGDTSASSPPHTKRSEYAGEERWEHAKQAVTLAMKKYKEKKSGSYKEYNPVKGAKNYKMANIYRYVRDVVGGSKAKEFLEVNYSASTK